MNPLEAKIIRSFRKLKRDIIDVQNQVVELSQSQEELSRDLLDIEIPKEKPKTKTKIVEVVRTVRPKTKAKTFVASKEGKSFHIRECPYAKNIKPKSKLSFKTKDAALNKGYKPCSCVK